MYVYVPNRIWLYNCTLEAWRVKTKHNCLMKILIDSLIESKNISKLEHD